MYRAAPRDASRSSRKRQLNAALRVDDLRGLDEADAEVQLEIYSQSDARARFVRWTNGRSSNSEFSCLDERRSRMHVRIDLLIMDGRSYELFFAELMKLYCDPQADLPPLELSFRDYISGLDALEKTAAFRDARDYWVGRVPELPAAPDLPLVKNPAAVSEPIFKRRSLRIEAADWRAMEVKRGARLHLTPSGILLVAFFRDAGGSGAGSRTSPST